jgi:hypothetical protein
MFCRTSPCIALTNSQAYYLSRGNEKKINAFPKGFHAIAGNPTKRSNTGTPAQKVKAVNFASVLQGSHMTAADTTQMPGYQ